MKKILLFFLYLFVFEILAFSIEPVFFGVSRYDLLINKKYSKKDIDTYLRENAYRGANFIRIYSFFYAPFQYGDSYLGGFPNTYIPWKIVKEEANHRKIFDLTQFSDEYTERLKWFMDAAKYYNITVDICILDTLGYRTDEVWHYHPFHPWNNIQGFDGNYAGGFWNAKINRTYFESYMKYLAQILNSYSNVLIELVNEAYPDSTVNMTEFCGFISWMSNKAKTLFPGKMIVYSGEAPMLSWIYYDIYCVHFVWSLDVLYSYHGGVQILKYIEGIPTQKILSSDGDGVPDVIWEVITTKNQDQINGIFEIAFKRSWWVDFTTLDYKQSFWVVENGSEIYKRVFGVYPPNKGVKKDPLITEAEEPEIEPPNKDRPRKG